MLHLAICESFPKGLLHTDAVCVISLRDSAQTGYNINKQLNEVLGEWGWWGGERTTCRSRKS